MSQHSTGLGKGRAQRVIRLHKLPQYLGVTRSTIDDMVKRDLLHPFSMTGMRAQVVLESEVAELQTKAQAKARRLQQAAEE